MTRQTFFRLVAALLVLFLLIAVATPQAVWAFDPANDDFDSAVVIGALPFSDSSDTRSATEASDDPTDCTSNGSVWYAFTPSADMVLVANTFGSSYDTVLSAYTGTRGALTIVPGACNDDFDGLQSRITFQASAGVTYYFLIGVCCGTGMDGGGDLVFALEEAVAPENDNFANAAAVVSIPFSHTTDSTGATLETGEPTPTCGWNVTASVWYAFTPAETGSISAGATANFSTAVAAYTGSALGSLTEVACAYYGLATFRAEAGTTYYFQVVGQYGNSGPLQFTLDTAPDPEAYFYFWPYNPSIFSVVQFDDVSYDPGGMEIVAWNWDFGDGTSSTERSPRHQYAQDGAYTVHLTIATPDGRSADTEQLVEVQTHDVAITRFAVPKSAKEGNTRNITVGVSNSRYPEMVRVELYRSAPGPYQGYEHIGSLTQYVPLRKGGRTTNFSFSYTFTAEDAAVGKVTFRAVATIVDAEDALAADNVAISKPVKVKAR